MSSKSPKRFSSSHTEALLALAHSSPWTMLSSAVASDMERVRSLYCAATAYYGDANRDVNVLVVVALSMPEDEVMWTVMRAAIDALRANITAQFEQARVRTATDKYLAKAEYDAKLTRIQSLEAVFLAAYEPELKKRLVKSPQWPPPSIGVIGSGRPVSPETNKQN